MGRQNGQATGRRKDDAGPVRGGLRFAFYGRISTEEWQDPVTSRARQLGQAAALVAGSGRAVGVSRTWHDGKLGRPPFAQSPRGNDARHARHRDRGGVGERYDVIVVGSGAGGGTVTHTLAPSGKRILLLERGSFLPRETGSGQPGPVLAGGKYISPGTWYDAGGNAVQPQVRYFAGGATKLYGAAPYRLRPAGFGEIQSADGLSPAWPVSYDDFEPWYTKAEWLYQVRGDHSEDPAEGHWPTQYPWPAVSHEPRVQQISDALAWDACAQVATEEW